ncbi:aminomethyltransferase family protein [Streptomyces aureus]|uniref:Aminomethyltransferase family protein n=1 Tax=Streptomyces aureus TaxID=193461 RepID=A0ABV4SM38_9ACTN
MTQSSAVEEPTAVDPPSATADTGGDRQPPAWPGTPFAGRTQELNQNAMWMLWGGKMISDIFTDLDREIGAIRSSVAMVDMSPLSKYDITGPDALDAVNRIITRDARKLEIGQTYYTPWCNEQGRLVNDGLVIRVDESTYRISADPNLDWLTARCASFDAKVIDVTDAYAILTIQGPRSTEVLASVTGSSWDDLKFSRLARTRIAGHDVDVLRQGFTGEIGYEIWIAAAYAVDVWDAVAAAGAPFGIEPAGAAAEDIARVEAGLLIVGYDYSAAGTDGQGASVQLGASYDASPFELGLGKFVDFSKDDFIGRAALEREAAEGSRTRLVGLEIDWRRLSQECERLGFAPLDLGRVRWEPVPLAGDGDPNRRASSVTWSRTTRKLVAFGHVSPQEAQQESVTLLWPVADSTVSVPARVVQPPFVSRRRSTSLG